MHFKKFKFLLVLQARNTFRHRQNHQRAVAILGSINIFHRYKTFRKENFQYSVLCFVLSLKLPMLPSVEVRRVVGVLFKNFAWCHHGSEAGKEGSESRYRP